MIGNIEDRLILWDFFLAFNNQMNTGEPDNDLQCRCDNDKRTAFFLMDVKMSDDGFNQLQRDADNEEAEQEQKDKDCTNHAWTSIRARSRP